MPEKDTEKEHLALPKDTPQVSCFAGFLTTVCVCFAFRIGSARKQSFGGPNPILADPNPPGCLRQRRRALRGAGPQTMRHALQVGALFAPGKLRVHVFVEHRSLWTPPIFHRFGPFFEDNDAWRDWKRRVLLDFGRFLQAEGFRMESLNLEACEKFD